MTIGSPRVGVGMVERERTAAGLSIAPGRDAEPSPPTRTTTERGGPGIAARPPRLLAWVRDVRGAVEPRVDRTTPAARGALLDLEVERLVVRVDHDVEVAVAPRCAVQAIREAVRVERQVDVRPDAVPADIVAPEAQCGRGSDATCGRRSSASRSGDGRHAARCTTSRAMMSRCPGCRGCCCRAAFAGTRRRRRTSAPRWPASGGRRSSLPAAAQVHHRGGHILVSSQPQFQLRLSAAPSVLPWPLGQLRFSL